ncbi:enolase-phosphatase E1 [Embiotoca jacksoni]|uniref:enolase-phosphatase E1 n=1 Tax=Embiotoca jacksoni TaxID=100190 RepID=UPI003704BB90
MSLKNGNTVALERRMDLASLFCMIGRHGPAVALAAIAVVSVLAGFIIYRSMRGKRRKATAGADSDSRSHAAEMDASPVQTDPEPSPEESRSSAESTDVSDESLTDAKEDADLIRSDLKIRHRRAEHKPPPYCPTESDPVTDNKLDTSGAQDFRRAPETYAEEADQSLQSDTVAGGDTEGDADCHRGLTDDAVKDAEEDRDNDGCLKPELIYNESHKEEKEVVQATYQEDETVATDEDLSDEKTHQEEDDLQCFSDGFKQNPLASENGDDDIPHDNVTTPDPNSVESNLEEPIVHIGDVPVSCNCYSKDAEFEEENHPPGSTDCFHDDGSNRLSPEKEKKSEGEKAEECLDNQLIAQQAEIVYSACEQTTNLPSSQRDQCDDVTDEETLSIQDIDGDDGHLLTGEVIEEDDDKDQLNNPAAVEFDAQPLQKDRRLQPEPQNENGLACNQECDVNKGKMLTFRDEECDSLRVELSPPLSPLVEPAESEKIDGDDGLSDATTDTKPQISSTVDSLDRSSDNQQPQSQDKELAPTLDNDADLDIFCPDLPPPLSKKKETGTVVVLAEESVDRLASSCYEDQQSGRMGNDETIDKTRVNCATDAAVCDETSSTAPVTSTEVPHPDTLPTFQDVQSDQIQNHTDSPEVTICAAPELIESINPPACRTPLQSFEQSGLTLSSSGLGEESGISSIAVGPDAVNDVTPANVVLHVTDLDRQYEGRAQNRLNADNVALPVINEDTAGTVIGSCPSNISQQPHSVHKHSGIVDFPDLPSCYQQTQTREKEEEVATTLDKDADLDILCPDSLFLQTKKNEIDTLVAFAEKSVRRLASSCYKDQQSGRMENDETIDKTRVNSATDAGLCDELASFTAPVTSTEVSRPDMLPSRRDAQNDTDSPKVTVGAAPEVVESIDPLACQIPLLSFEQSELSWSTSRLGEESGISSMAVSPDLPDADHDMTCENAVLLVTGCDPQREERSQSCLYADDVAVSVLNEDTEGLAPGSRPSYLSHKPYREHRDRASDASFAANEDTFGHEIENSYHREVDQLTEQTGEDDMRLTVELTKQTRIKAVAEAVEVKEKKEGAKKEEEEGYEKTEISIMEATMDHNEWITEGNYQVLPWMNPSVPYFAQNPTKPEPPPTEEHHDGSSPAVVACVDTDIPPSTEVGQPGSVFPLDANAENNKKVVAVQPVPQNVNVTFRIHYLTHLPYQKVAIAGNQQELGNWKDFIPLERAKDGLWSTVVSLPAESHVEWKFVVVDKGEVCRWEECGNRLLDTGYGDDLIVHKWWGFL